MGNEWLEPGMEEGLDKYRVSLAFNFSFLNLTCSSGLLGTWAGRPHGIPSGPLGVNGSARGGGEAVSCLLPYSLPTAGKRLCKQTWHTQLQWVFPQPTDHPWLPAAFRTWLSVSPQPPVIQFPVFPPTPRRRTPSSAKSQASPRPQGQPVPSCP